MCIQDTKHTARPIASALGQQDLSWVLMKEDIFKQLNLPVTSAPSSKLSRQDQLSPATQSLNNS